jgi:hypothetical protein
MIADIGASRKVDLPESAREAKVAIRLQPGISPIILKKSGDVGCG